MQINISTTVFSFNFNNQAYEEIKSVYANYPKRGLSWSHGWIDRGGWKPQTFSGDYFYAYSESLNWHYADDTELVIDYANREVRYRSSARMGQADWDVQRLRYNEFVLLLSKKNGWDVKPMEKYYYYLKTPFRWTQMTLDFEQEKVEAVLDSIVNTLSSLSSAPPLTGNNDVDNSVGSARRALAELITVVEPYVKPVVNSANDVFEQIKLDPRIAGAVQVLQDFQTKIEEAISSVSIIPQSDIDTFVEKINSLIRPSVGFNPTGINPLLWLEERLHSVGLPLDLSGSNSNDESMNKDVVDDDATYINKEDYRRYLKSFGTAVDSSKTVQDSINGQTLDVPKAQGGMDPSVSDGVTSINDKNSKAFEVDKPWLQKKLEANDVQSRELSSQSATVTDDDIESDLNDVEWIVNKLNKPTNRIIIKTDAKDGANRATTTIDINDKDRIALKEKLSQLKKLVEELSVE